MATSGHAEILGVNISGDINNALVAGFQKTFLQGCRMSVYSRPSDRDHPRLRPTKSRYGVEFDIVVFDVGRVSVAVRDEDVLSLGLVPEWFEEDVLGVLGSAAVVVLSPLGIMQGVRAAFSRALRRRIAIVREREPAQWRQGGVHPAVDVLRIWSRSAKKGNGGAWWSFDDFAVPE